MIRVLVWNEFRHEKKSERVQAVYPDGIHSVIAEFLGKEEDIEVKTACLGMNAVHLIQKLVDSVNIFFSCSSDVHCFLQCKKVSQAPSTAIAVPLPPGGRLTIVPASYKKLLICIFCQITQKPLPRR